MDQRIYQDAWKLAARIIDEWRMDGIMHAGQEEANELAARITTLIEREARGTVDQLADAAGVRVIPRTPAPGMIESMCLRFRHDWGHGHNPDDRFCSGPSPADRRALRATMRQLYEEVAGVGFYRPEKEEEYAALARKFPGDQDED